jgi:formylglycine-generating enzyme required for sulfatase activity
MIYNTRLSLLLLFLITTISSAFAQQKLTFRVADFSYDAFDQTARDERFKRYDGSGFLYAIVKVSGDSPADKLGEYRFNFGNMNHIVEDHDGELWLYVQKNAKIVTITRNGYFPVNHYDLNTTIESGKTYRMKLSAQAPKVYTQMVMFSITPADSKARVTIMREGTGQSEEVFGDIDETGGVANALEFGTYTYKVTAMNYHSSEGRFTLNSQADTHEEKVVLRRNGAKVTLSAASEADIYINGIKRGTRSWTGLMKAGNYTIECRQANHRPSQQTISVEEGKSRTYQLTSPAPITGTLSLNSRPLGANIQIDGKDYGTTPRNIRDLLIGKHSITLSMSGYATKTEECNIKENETLSLEMTLDKSNESTTIPQTISADGDKVFTVNGVSFTMKPVAGGKFTMTAVNGGSAIGVMIKLLSKMAQITLSDFYIGETEVTQELWEAVMGGNPSDFKGSNRPVERVSWNDCQEFIRKLNEMTGQKFRLPTEAEWEYAARGGKNSKGYKYSGSNYVEDVAWYAYNCGGTHHAVKTKQPNELGIYDMSGNVWEWCNDWYGDYSSNAQTNPTAPSKGSYRVYRGGSWFDGAGDCRVSRRYDGPPVSRDSGLGLRLAL